MTLFRAENENTVAGFEVTEDGWVTKCAPIIYKKVSGLRLEQAIRRLESLGWTVTLVKE